MGSGPAGIRLLRTPEGGAPGTAHEGRGESRELNEVITNRKRVPNMHVVRRVNATNEPNQIIDSLIPLVCLLNPI